MAFAAACLALVPAQPALAQFQLPNDIVDELVCGGLSQPVGLAFTPDGRLIVAELRTGRLRLVVDDALVPEPLVTVDSVNTNHGERGLLGVCVDARWPARPYVYVHYNHQDGHVRISRYKVTGDLQHTGSGALAIDPASRYDILTDVVDVNGPHNGGTVRFGPDGMLYASFGDDFDDCAAQNLDSLNGKIVRLDVGYLPDGPGGPPDKSVITPPYNPFPPGPNGNAGLVWALGFRNPFRFHVDYKTGDLFAADVGAATWEEVDWMPESGMNFGWPLYEGPASFWSCGGVSPLGMTPPILSVDRTEYPSSAGCSVGLYRYVPGAIHALGAEYDGSYFWHDISVGDIRRLTKSAGTWSLAAPVPGQPTATDWAQGFAFVTDWLQGPDGAIYYARNLYGEIRRIQNYYLVSAPVETVEGVGFSEPYPSPSNGDPVMLTWSLDRPSQVNLAIYDVAGRRVRTLIDGAQKPAKHFQVRWDGRDSDARPVASGMYFARLLVNDRVSLERRITWLR